jgi:hypothetical protein
MDYMVFVHVFSEASFTYLFSVGVVGRLYGITDFV